MKAIAFIRENRCGDKYHFGTHNGYVAVPPGNKYHGESYCDMPDIHVHGGLTFSEPVINGEKTFMSKRKYKPEYVGKRNPILDNAEFLTENTEIGDDWWIFGFDTFHYPDNKFDNDRDFVVRETMELLEQLEGD